MSFFPHRFCKSCRCKISLGLPPCFLFSCFQFLVKYLNLGQWRFACRAHQELWKVPWRMVCQFSLGAVSLLEHCDSDTEFWFGTSDADQTPKMPGDGLTLVAKTCSKNGNDLNLMSELKENCCKQRGRFQGRDLVELFQFCWSCLACANIPVYPGRRTCETAVRSLTVARGLSIFSGSNVPCSSIVTQTMNRFDLEPQTQTSPPRCAKMAWLLLPKHAQKMETTSTWWVSWKKTAVNSGAVFKAVTLLNSFNSVEAVLHVQTARYIPVVGPVRQLWGLWPWPVVCQFSPGAMSLAPALWLRQWIASIWSLRRRPAPQDARRWPDSCCQNMPKPWLNC